MIVYTTAQTDDEIVQILELQKKNLPQNLTNEQICNCGRYGTGVFIFLQKNQ